MERGVRDASMFQEEILLRITGHDPMAEIRGGFFGSRLSQKLQGHPNRTYPSGPVSGSTV